MYLDGLVVLGGGADPPFKKQLLNASEKEAAAVVYQRPSNVIKLRRFSKKRSLRGYF